MSNKIRVAIVEDADEIRDGLTFLVNASEDFTCVGSYYHAEPFLEAVSEIKPQVVILDIGLPGMSGIDCIHRLKDIAPGVLIMMFTVFDDDDHLFDALMSGANGYILKKTAPAAILDALKELHMGGAPMSPQISRRILDFVRGKKATINPEVGALFNLSKRELEILELMSAGYRNKEIADKLFISNHTVRSHIYNIYEKLHVQSRIEAINKIAG